jgi:hypothetical protein
MGEACSCYDNIENPNPGQITQVQAKPQPQSQQNSNKKAAQHFANNTKLHQLEVKFLSQASDEKVIFVHEKEFPGGLVYTGYVNL